MIRRGDGSTFPFVAPDNDALQKTDIILNPNGGDAVNDYSLSVWIYSTTTYNDWKNAINADPNRTENELRFIDEYSEYVIKMSCNIKILDGAIQTMRAGSGCCLRDWSNDGGGYCMKYNVSTETGTTLDTLYLSES